MHIHFEEMVVKETQILTNSPLITLEQSKKNQISKKQT
jgi:hypothetical protein